MIKVYIFIIVLLGLGSDAYGVKGIDIPTVGSIERGKYTLDFRIYNGGLLNKLMVGFNDTLSFGVPLDIKNAVGTGGMSGSFPPLVCVQFTPLKRQLYVSVGYFNPYYKEKGAYKENIGVCGFYLIFSKPLFLKTYKTFASFGGAVDFKKSYSFFCAADVTLNNTFHIIAEGIHVYYPKNKEETFINLGLYYELVDRFGITFALHRLKNRTFTLSYRGILF